MMKVRIIELLNKIANGEELPKTVIFKNIQYDLDKQDDYANYGYADENNCDRWLFDDEWEINRFLNDEVEVLEDNTEEIEELPEERIENCTDRNYAYLATKYNELVKVVKEIRKDLNK